MSELFDVSLPSGESEEDLQLFGYAFSHDLKASLRPVLGFGHYLQMGEVSDARAGEFQNKILQAASTLEQQLDGMAEYVKLCLRPPRPEALELETLLRAVVEHQLGQFQLGEDCVKWGGRIGPAVADRGILKLVFSELVRNALLFKPPDQEPRVNITWGRRGDRVETLIEDSGLGIRSDCLTLLGKPFQRFHHQVPGVGLGLARALRGLAAMQGRLSCLSQPGQGSTFLVSLGAA